MLCETPSLPAGFATGKCGLSPGFVAQSSPSNARRRPFTEHDDACELLARALGRDGFMDFPTVTEICEHCCGDSSKLEAVAKMLTSALCNGLDDGDVSLCLKALTMAHELLYDPCACKVLVETPGFVEACELSCEASPKGDKLSSWGPAVETARVLAWETKSRLQVEAQLRRPRLRMQI
eukprot:TRINITY_DN32735_c0_g1_i1.p1 TRINITY_DN32735_c0_g1~~TRINITY_DN32735_c0_g1_i1.p1  ORF type:complete len:205 (+),score=25.45 TRINITY_DN32735_c0_g1_i1:79-615(+)